MSRLLFYNIDSKQITCVFIIPSYVIMISDNLILYHIYNLSTLAICSALELNKYLKKNNPKTPKNQANKTENCIKIIKEMNKYKKERKKLKVNEIKRKEAKDNSQH